MHQNHRRRMKDRYLRDGFDSFATHELLEMLLYYSKARVDTNECAHLLLERFGSLKDVLEADLEALEEVPGIGEHSAIMIKLCLELIKRYSKDQSTPVTRYTSLSQILHYLFQLYIGVTRERLYMMLFNNRMNLLDCVLVSEGTVNSTSLPLAKINDIIVKKKAAAVVLAHNHPNGLAVPSPNDYELTDSLQVYLESIEIAFVEHLLIADNRFYPILKHRSGMFRSSPYGKNLGSDFYKLFYDLDESQFTFPPIYPEDSAPAMDPTEKIE